MTEPDLDLGENDNSEPNDFPPSERQIHTQAYDLSINTLKEQWDDDTLVIPDFQREYVWDNAKASRLIESLLLNIPVPVLFFSETVEANYQIVDGHQRVYTVVRYLDNQFALTGLRIQDEFKGLRFHELPEREKRFLKTRVMRAIIIGADSSPNMKFEVFERLNTGGLALNAQEIRHALNMGTFSELLKELEQDDAFRACLGTGKPRKRMVDQELALRFFALRDRLRKYRTPLVRFLNEYMRDNRHQHGDWISNQREVFHATMNLVHEVLGAAAFRVTDLKGRPTEKVINRAVFEAQSIVFSICDRDLARERASELRSVISALFDDDNFDQLIRKATGDRSRTYGRILRVANAFESAGVPIERAVLDNLSLPVEKS